MTISFNPLLATNAAGFFGVSSDGFVQGVADDDPAIRWQLANGFLASTETLPMWGGVAVVEYIPADPTTIPMSTPWSAYGAPLVRATSTISGFTVFNQAYAWITTPQGPVPVAANGMTVPYYRMGSGARIALACDPALASIAGTTDTPSQAVTWDYTQMLIQPKVSSASTETISSISITGNVATVTMAGAISGWTITVGDYVNISGATLSANTGSTSAGYINETQKVASVTSSTIFTFNLPANLGTWGTVGGSPVVNYGGGTALAVQVLKVQVGGSKVVRWDAVNNLAYWDNTGSCALVQI